MLLDRRPCYPLQSWIPIIHPYLTVKGLFTPAINSVVEINQLIFNSVKMKPETMVILYCPQGVGGLGGFFTAPQPPPPVQGPSPAPDMFKLVQVGPH